MFVLLLAVLFYVGYIFPETAKLFVRFGIDLPPMTAFTLDISDFLVANPILIAAFTFIPPIALLFYIRTPKGKSSIC